ncbi:MAG: AMMECR1 family protein [Treponema sp.]|jgi:AMMECR1 domain-containing protein|nr:AMMECR1 family protein [Treponema sp.]
MKKIIYKAIFPATILCLFFSCSPQKTAWDDPAYKKLQESYSLELQKEILQSARDSIFRVWSGAERPEQPLPGPNEGIAVRLIVHGQDRGCLTWYRNTGDIKLFAAYCAAEALRDPRYEPLKPEEAKDTILELSIFGSWEEISNPEDFTPGLHNLWLYDGVFNTILQASLASQRNYTKEIFLEAICQKAGLDKNAWKEDSYLVWRRSPSIWYYEPL